MSEGETKLSTQGSVLVEIEPQSYIIGESVILSLGQDPAVLVETSEGTINKLLISWDKPFI